MARTKKKEAVPEPSYAEIVWGQFKKNRLSYVALWLFGLLFLLAIFAPVISHNQPFWVTVETGYSGNRPLSLEPPIEAFELDDSDLGPEDTTTLHWAAPEATSVTLEISGPDRELIEAIEIEPAAFAVGIYEVGPITDDLNFRLVAESEAGRATARLSVQPLGEITERTEYPWAESLVLNTNVFGKGIDIFFNLLLIALPGLIPLYFVFNLLFLRGRTGRVRVRRIRRVTLLLLFAILGLQLAIIITKPRTNYTRWREAAAFARIDGVTFPLVDVPVGGGEFERVVVRDAQFPLLSYHYADTSYDTLRPSSPEHILGTDISGRDLFVRMLYGTRISLTVGVIAVGIYVFIGIILGALAGFLGGRADILIQRLIEVMMCFPTFILILTVMSFLTYKSIFAVMVIIGLTRWTTTARLVRGEFLKLKQTDFVQAAIAGGLTSRSVIFKHVLPNAMGPVLVAATFGIADAILIEASLSFLGVSDIDAPSWGRILTVGRSLNDLFTMLLPGLAIFLTVTLLNLIGEGLRDALDPKLRR